ncbi:AAA family ATPase [Aridibaculum aurantiacum]|uniref:AAA family ATPase n=1 Tax=Aridibaculum aurantiacum TaxID=2810307 RepID=UPI001A9692A8|nr:AAA family ATPase [Aridibaculum aurantiacum]
MEAIIFCGIQAAGKTSFFIRRFIHTHLRISLDLLNTRNKERQMLQTCLDMQQRFVIDNTNATKAARANYITQAKERKFKVIGYYFTTGVLQAIERNKQRQGKHLVPEKGIWGTNKILEPPAYEEGFDELYTVKITDNDFVVQFLPKPVQPLL